jgi:hypothetical protein
MDTCDVGGGTYAGPNVVGHGTAANAAGSDALAETTRYKYELKPPPTENDLGIDNWPQDMMYGSGPAEVQANVVQQFHNLLNSKLKSPKIVP